MPSIAGVAQMQQLFDRSRAVGVSMIEMVEHQDCLLPRPRQTVEMIAHAPPLQIWSICVDGRKGERIDQLAKQLVSRKSTGVDNSRLPL